MSCAVLERRGAERPSVDVLVVSVPAPLAPAARTVPWSTLAIGAMTVAIPWWAIENASTLQQATSVLSGLSVWWVLLAAVAASTTWVFSGVSQQGALAPTLPFRQLLATQFAGTFANQFTPAGLGGSAVNVRFLRRQGLAVPEAVASVGLTQIAGVAVHLTFLASVLAADPSLADNVPSGSFPFWLRLVVGGVVAAAFGVVTARRAWVVERLHALWLQAVSAVAHLRRPRRIAELLLGSLGLTVAHVLVLFGTLRAMDAKPSLIAVAAAYLLATTAAAVVPSPGGIGSVDASLALFLYGAGVTAAAAIAAVLVYRLLTSWLALAPSAATLNVLIRRGTI
jgi:uncharacterized membrane protein YbhN (UPF0104 family)